MVKNPTYQELEKRITELERLTLEKHHNFLKTILTLTPGVLKSQQSIIHLLAEFNEVTSHLDTSKIISKTIEFISDSMEYGTVSIVFFDAVKEDLSFVGLKLEENVTELTPITVLNAKDTVISEVISEQKPRYIIDLEKEAGAYPVEKMLIEKGLKSAFYVPLIYEDVCIGTLNVGSTEIDGFDYDARYFLTLLSPRIALSLQNANLYEKLKEKQAVLKTIMDTTSDIIVLKDKDFAYKSVNRAFCEFLNRSEDELLGKNDYDFFSKEEADVFREEEKNVMASGKEKVSEVEATGVEDKRWMEVWMEVTKSPVIDGSGNAVAILCTVKDITARKKMETEREKIITELTGALDNIDTLSGLLPICASCKKIRDDQGYWNQIESYISKRTGTLFSHSICPDCATKLYPDIDTEQLYARINNKKNPDKK